MTKKTFIPSRREFLKSAGLLVPTVGLAGIPFSSCTPEVKISADTLFDLFKDPPPEAKPFFRWWWNGNRVEKEEIAREIKLMKDAGAGGIEINPIAMPQQVPNTPGEEGLVWLSDEWCEMVRYTADEARKNGMDVDLIVGTGWPFGGEFLTPDETIQGLTFETVDVKGTGDKSFTLRAPEEHEKIYRIFLVPATAKSIDEITEVSVMPDPDNRITINIPEDNSRVVIVRIKKGFREVFRGAPGGAGPVLDHFNAEAVSKYLTHMSEALNPYFDGNLGNGIRAMFCDSIELEGANWTGDFPEEFEKRRGYPVIPWLPLLFTSTDITSDLKDGIERARYDFSLTLAELFRERFILVFHDWCKKNKVLSRYQAYGFPWLYTDLVDGYMIPDIPEGDQWLFNPGWSTSRIDGIRYAIWNKYASSGGHLADRRIISSEAMTNTSGVFRTTLKYIKQAADLNFLAGINHLVLHGFNYSPAEAGFPGWIQYGTYFNEHNPWWPYVSKFMEYTARISGVFQHCTPVSQVAILGPTPDIWREHGLDRNPFNTEPWYLHSLWQAFSSQGISVDYINGEIFRETTFENETFDLGAMSYQALLVVHARSMEMPAARSILQYIETGGRVIFLEGYPSKSPGMYNYREFDELVHSSIEKAIEGGAQVEEPPDEKWMGNLESLSEWAGNFIERFQLRPGVTITNPDGHMMTAQYSHGRFPVFFISNVHQQKTLNTGILFPEEKGAWSRWDPESGERMPLETGKEDLISLTLRPLESALIIGGHKKGKSKKPQEADKEKLVSGDWEIECIPKIEGEVLRKRIGRLENVATLPELENFSGTIIYRKTLTLDDTDYNRINIGVVNDLAEVFLNGRSLGVDWYGKGSFLLEGSLQAGKNELEIHVVNTLLNYCISRQEDPEIGYWLERYHEKPDPAPTGLIGPVMLLGMINT